MKKDNKQNKQNSQINLTDSICYDDITTKLYEDFYQLWDPEQITIVADLLKLANKQTDTETKISFIEAIDSIIKNKEKKSLELIDVATENITN